MPLLRTKCLSVGVMASSSRCAGVSALSGRSLSTTKPSLPRMAGIVGERDRDEVLRHAAVEGDRPADQRRHGGKPGTF